MDNPYQPPTKPDFKPAEGEASWLSKKLQLIVLILASWATIGFVLVAVLLTLQAIDFLTQPRFLSDRETRMALGRATAVLAFAAVLALGLNIFAIIFARRRRTVTALCLFLLSFVVVIAAGEWLRY
ncbi:MAG: hypothetical protein AAF664_26270 [Planctomycetota bacterium]